MTNADTRADIAAALSTVPGIKGYSRRPNAAKAGDAWPLWRGSERDGGASYLNTWAVVVLLPSSEQTADEFMDAHQDALDDALRPHLFVDSYAPSTLPAEAGEAFALLITGRSE